jgi:selenocysteine-specific elongation factor
VHVVATAGHVDHGKSTLVLALTGMDPDRFAEEKARGLTIDLGFAWATLPSGRGVAFVDVPGHVRFIRNMLAGVGAVDACMFAVAATEAWKPQSEEHLRILELLGIRHGLVALTKVGLVDDEWRELAALEIADRVAGTFLEGAQIVAVDALAGTGLDDLREALDRLLATTPTSADHDRPRLWVDRSFAAKGSGTVVTGTLTGGVLAVGDDLTAITAAKGGKGTAVRVRGLQSHQQPHPSVGPGHRVAVNLTGIHHGDIRRGDAIVRGDQWAPTMTLDASLRVLPSLDHNVTRRGAYVVYLGSGEYPARVRVLGGSGIEPGDSGLVRCHLPVAVPLLPGDRFVLRESGRSETVGGGEILDVAPVLPASKARPSRSVERVIEERGWVDTGLLTRLTGETRPAVVGHWVVSRAAMAAAEHEVIDAVAAAGPLGLDLATLKPRQRAVAAMLDQVDVRAGRAWPAGEAAPAAADQALAGHPWRLALLASRWSPPPPAESDRPTTRELVRRGLVVERDGVYFATEAIDEAARVVARMLRDTPGGVTVAEVRTALRATRKHVLPLLAQLDATGVTRRRGDLRIAGPRLPEMDGVPEK